MRGKSHQKTNVFFPCIAHAQGKSPFTPCRPYIPAQDRIGACDSFHKSMQAPSNEQKRKFLNEWLLDLLQVRNFLMQSLLAKGSDPPVTDSESEQQWMVRTMVEYLKYFFNNITDPMTWSRMWQDFLVVIQQGHPPIYVQYLIATVIFLAYLLFFYDPKRERLKGTKRWIFFMPGVFYSLSLIFITAGGFNFVSFLLDPDTYYQALLQIKAQLPH